MYLKFFLDQIRTHASARPMQLKAVQLEALLQNLIHVNLNQRDGLLQLFTCCYIKDDINCNQGLKIVTLQGKMVQFGQKECCIIMGLLAYNVFVGASLNASSIQCRLSNFNVHTHFVGSFFCRKGRLYLRYDIML